MSWRTLILVALFSLLTIGGADARGKRSPRKPNAAKIARAAAQVRLTCEADCTKSRAACGEAAEGCDAKHKMCTEQCLTSYLASLPENERARVLAEIEAQKRAAAAAAEAEEQRQLEARARANAITRAEAFADRTEAMAKQANQAAAAACEIARSSSLPEPPCDSAAATTAAAEARAAAQRANQATDIPTANAEADKSMAALATATRARDLALESQRESELEVDAEKQRRADELSARAAANSRRLARRSSGARRFVKNDRRKQRRRRGWLAVGLGAGAAVASFLCYRLEQGRYDAIAAGDFATLEALRAARGDARLYNAGWLALGGASVVGIAIGVPLILGNRAKDDSHFVAVSSPRFHGLVWTGTLP